MQLIFMKFTWTLCFHLQRWVWAYRKDRFNVKVNTTNGVERSIQQQFKIFGLKITLILLCSLKILVALTLNIKQAISSDDVILGHESFSMSLR